jgi:exosortase/archaeosortase family protein
VGNAKSINIFLAKIFGFYFFWLVSDAYLSHQFVFYNSFWLGFYHILLTILSKSSVFILELIGYQTIHDYRGIAILGSYGVIIGNHCVGFGLIYGVFSLFSAYPAPLKLKLWFIPLSMLLVMFSNIIRVITLVISSNKNANFIDIEQHDLFNYIIYILVFILWIIWIQFLIPKNKELQNT